MPEEKSDSHKRGAGLSPSNDTANLPTGKLWFLGIGIDRYRHFSPLNNAVKDVNDLVALLREKYGFDAGQMITVFNEAATRDNIIDSLDVLLGQVGPEDKLLLYYSGHGYSDKASQLSYWIPQDAKLGRTSGYIPNSTVRDYLKAIPALHTLLISDSCFSGTLFVRGAGNLKVAKDLEKRRSRWGLVSGRDNEEVDDGKPGTNSPFAASLLEVLRNNRSKWLSVASLANQVIERTRYNHNQLPEGNPLFGVGHDGGQFIFYLSGHDENKFWERCLQANKLSVYSEYLDQFPNGVHANEALQLIKELEEAEEWQQVKEEDTIYSYRKFLLRYRDGKYAQEAVDRLQRLNMQKQVDAELRFWNRISGIDEFKYIYLFEEYLQKYPQGKFAADAKERINAITSREKQAAQDREIEQAWKQVVKINSRKALEAFIEKYPGNQYVHEARTLIQTLQAKKNRTNFRQKDAPDVTGKANQKKKKDRPFRWSNQPLLGKLATNKTYVRRAVKQGLLGAIALIIIDVFFNYSGITSPDQNEASALFVTLVNIAIIGRFNTKVVTIHRDEDLSGRISFYRAFITGALMVLIMVFINILWNYLYDTLIDPDRIEAVITNTIEQLVKEGGLGYRAEENQVASMRRSFIYTPLGMSIIAGLYTCIIGLATNLVIALVIKKYKPTTV